MLPFELEGALRLALEGLDHPLSFFIAGDAAAGVHFEALVACASTEAKRHLAVLTAVQLLPPEPTDSCLVDAAREREEVVVLRLCFEPQSRYGADAVRKVQSKSEEHAL
jgi:hypothetical protein